MKCRECEFASVHKYPRNGNGNSAHVRHFGRKRLTAITHNARRRVRYCSTGRRLRATAR